MNQFDKKKSCYLQPRVKVVSFAVESGFSASEVELLGCTQEYIDVFEGNHDARWGGRFGDCSFGTSEYGSTRLGWGESNE